MSDRKPRRSVYEQMTQWKIIPGLALAVILALLAFITPIGAWFGLLMPPGRNIADWFMRSGAITTVFAFAAQEQAANAIWKLTPNSFGTEELNMLRRIFLRPLEWIKRFIFWLAIAGSVIWAYGDIVMLSMQPSG